MTRPSNERRKKYMFSLDATTRERLENLAEMERRSMAQIIELAVEEFYQTRTQESEMTTPSEGTEALYSDYVSNSTTYAEVAGMTVAEIAAGIREMNPDEADPPGAAELIHEYAVENVARESED